MAYQLSKSIPKDRGFKSTKISQFDQVHLKKKNKKSIIFHPLREIIHDRIIRRISQKENQKRKSLKRLNLLLSIDGSLLPVVDINFLLFFLVHSLRAYDFLIIITKTKVFQ